MEGGPDATNRSWANTKITALIELAIVALVFLADYYGWHHIIQISKTLYLLPLGWLSLRLRGLSWKSVGHSRYQTWGRTLGFGILFGIGMEALELIVTHPLMHRLLHKWTDLSEFQPLIGSTKLLLLYLALAWTLAAFGEELVYRGYLMNRVADLFGRGRLGWGLSLILVSIAFGLSHFYQGASGQLENLVDGFVLGGIYLYCDKKLSVPIVAHGVGDTMDIVLIFLGKYPGM